MAFEYQTALRNDIATRNRSGESDIVLAGHMLAFIKNNRPLAF